jgi:hypothetical protein
MHEYSNIKQNNNLLLNNDKKESFCFVLSDKIYNFIAGTRNFNYSIRVL